MGSAGNNTERQIYTLGQKQMGCGNEGLCIGYMIKHFLTAIVHLDTGIATDIGLRNHFQDLTGVNPKT